MEKKESYRSNLPHFQQPGQAYFVTWSLHDAVPPKALHDYTLQLNSLNNNLLLAIHNKLDEKVIQQLKTDYYIVRKKFMKAYEDVLHLEHKSIVNLSHSTNTQIVLDTLCYWQGVRLQNHAICVMSNHVHWVFKLFEKDESNKPVYLQDILQSVKRFSATAINQNEGLKGTLWQKESFDTTIRDEKHLYEAIEYTKNNPVSAKLVSDWKDWRGTLIFE